MIFDIERMPAISITINKYRSNFFYYFLLFYDYLNLLISVEINEMVGNDNPNKKRHKAKCLNSCAIDASVPEIHCKMSIRKYDRL